MVGNIAHVANSHAHMQKMEENCQCTPPEQEGEKKIKTPPSKDTVGKS